MITLTFNKLDGTKDEFKFSGRVPLLSFLDMYIYEKLLDNSFLELEITILEDINNGIQA